MSHASLPNFTTKKARLKDRAHMLKTVRSFFHEKGIIEVDCPCLSPFASVDTHIDLIPALYQSNQKVFLHTSPEYGMKRLLAEGMGDIYQLSHVFRDGEWSSKHNPEFTMAEWYRLGFTFEQMIDETVQFIQLFLNAIPFRVVTYRNLFLEKTGIDYVSASENDLFDYIHSQSLSYYPSIKEEGKDGLLNLILGSAIEPHLGFDELCIIAHYPASQAALAKKQTINGEEVAERFEIYYRGVELSNGYHELADSEEQKERLMEANATRIALGKNSLPIDENFLNALRKGLPACCGVAVGFDRLMMLRQNQTEISKVLSWCWQEA